MARVALNFNPLNPVALREMRARMRGPRAFVTLGFYLGLLAVLLYVVYLRSGGGTTYTYGGFSGSSNFGPTRSFEIGQNLFITVFLFLTIFVTVVTPAIMGGVVSRELEKRTYELLMITPVRSRAVAFGKLFAALGYLFFMLIAALPMACIVFIFGGVTFEHILIGYGVVFMAALTYAIIGLFFSALVKHTGPAIVLTYGAVALMLIGAPLLSSSIVSSLNSDLSRQTTPTVRIDPRTDPSFDLPKRILVVNPVAAVGSILARNAPYRLNATDDFLQLFPNSRLFGGSPNQYYSGSGNRFANEVARKPVLPGEIPLWGGYFLVYTALSIFFFLLSLLVMKPGLRLSLPGRRASSAKVSPPLLKEKGRRKKKKEAGTGLEAGTVALTEANLETPAIPKEPLVTESQPAHEVTPPIIAQG